MSALSTIYIKRLEPLPIQWQDLIAKDPNERYQKIGKIVLEGFPKLPNERSFGLEMEDSLLTLSNIKTSIGQLFDVNPKYLQVLSECLHHPIILKDANSPLRLQSGATASSHYINAAYRVVYQDPSVPKPTKEDGIAILRQLFGPR